MDLRVGKDLHARLKHASDTYGISISDIARRALRKWRREIRGSVESLKIKKGSTYGGAAVKLLGIESLAVGLGGSEIRWILDWYLRIYESRPERLQRPLELEKGREGVDFIIKEAV